MSIERFTLQELPPELLEGEMRRIVSLVQAAVPQAEVHPVGSTAVPGVIGKQDVDILVRVPAEAFAETRQALDAVLRRNPDQLSNDEFQGYVVDSSLDAAVQLTIAGGPNDTFLAFAEALRSSPELVEAYNALKRQWNGRPMEEYRAAKAEFIAAVLRN